MKQQTFLRGALILLIAGFINRIMGFVLRVVMVHYLGDEGIGLYSMVFPIYVTFILLSTAGFPVAVAKLVSEKNAVGDVRAVDRLFRLSMIFVLGTSLMLALILCLTARWMAEFVLSDLRTYRLLLAIAPALIFVSAASVLRSYFQGLRTMTPTAISQTIEQAVRIGATMLLVMWLAGRGLSYAAAGAAMGITMGELSGMFILILFFIYHRFFKKGNDLLSRDLHTAPPTTYTYTRAFKDLLKLAIPITFGRVIVALAYSMDAVLIPGQLQKAGLTVAEATSQFGQLTGIALQILFLPTIFSVALTTSLVPTISDALARDNMQTIRVKYHEVLRITFYMGIPATLFFVFRGRAICELLFNFPEAGSLLAILGICAISTYFIQIAGGVLNGLGKPHLSVKNMLLGAGFKLGGLLTLTSHPLFGIKGAAISLAAGWFVSSIADFISIGRIVGFRMDLVHLVGKPFLGTLLLYGALPVFDLAGAFFGLGAKGTTLFSIVLSILCYFIWMILVKGITKEDLAKFK